MMQSQQITEELYDCYTKTAANIICYFGENEKKDKLKELRDIVENNCVQAKKLTLVESVKNRLLNVYNDDDDDENKETDIEFIIQQYKEAISEINVDSSDDDKLLVFDKQLNALLEEDEENDADADLQLKGGYINVIDPISKKRIVDPVKSTVCGHTYDRESITQILKINKKTRCPVMGCKSKEFVTLAHLRADIVTKTYLDKNPA